MYKVEIPIDTFLSDMFYFSFITLLTIGYEDIVPIIDVSQTAVVMEGIIGQFYVASWLQGLSRSIPCIQIKNC